LRLGLEFRRRPFNYDPNYFVPFALAASHWAFVISTKPLPLQEFMPLQEFLALMHDDCPLHEFTPVHFTFASSACVVTEIVEKSTAAATATATPEALRSIISNLLF
jgi:hypothetical protein